MLHELETGGTTGRAALDWAIPWRPRRRWEMIKNYADHAANERTFLAWVRTAVAIVGFGLAAARLSSSTTSLWSEAALLGSGALVISVAYVRMRSLRRQIRSREELDDQRLSTETLLLVLVTTLFLLLAVFAVHVI